MLYVFLVDTGTMLAFDMNLTVECVSKLKEVIGRACGIPEDKQVLLISGGESLDPNVRVCSYSAGTDTNPIFLFSKSTIESSVPPSPSVDYGSDADLREQVDGSLNLPPTYMTVVARSQLAQQFHDVAKEQTRLCERLVHDQHLQQQGWAAVVANLEDISSAFKTRTEVFEQNFQVYLESRDQYMELLKNFNHDRELLGRIPVLRTLLKPSRTGSDVKPAEEDAGEECDEMADVFDDDDQDIGAQLEGPMAMSLLQWISSKDQQSSLEGMAEQCSRGLDQFSREMFDGLCQENRKTVESVDNASMKEVKGLEDRLYGLEQLIHEARKIVQEQCDLAQAFMQNQTRAGNLGDVSVLPDLCASHRKQLMVMLQNHKQLQDIRRRCIRAKEELSVNLHARLRWIMYVERSMSDVDGKLVIYHENLKRLKRHLEVIHQIHLAPSIYFAFVVEVVRRRSFTTTFLQWSKVLSTRATELYNKEVMARREFLSKVGNHFLYALFPGLEDFPPPYALQAPQEFDSELPDIRPSDVDALKRSLPEMASSLALPDMGAVPVIGSRSVSCGFHPQQSGTMQESRAAEGQRIEATAATAESPKDEKEPEESEPDTEEFETLEGGGGSGGAAAAAAASEPGAVLMEEEEAMEAAKETDEPSVSEVRSHGSDCSIATLAAPSVSAPTPPPSTSSPPPPPPWPLVQPANLQIHGVDPAESDSCAAANNSSQDFFTTDFYIDESMPSSYMESNGTGGGALVVTAAASSSSRGNMVKSHHVIVAELQNRLDEKGSAITQLQEDMCQSRTRIQHLEEKLRQLQTLESETITKLRRDVADAREFVLHSRNAFLCHMVALSAQVSDMTEIVRERICSENDAAVRDALSSAKEEHAKVVAEICRQLELESSKLRDACLEVERYQDQLQQGNAMIDSLKMEMATQLEEQRRHLDMERGDVVRSMTLEHELELENLREAQQRHVYEHEEQIRLVQEELDKKTEELDDLTTRHSSLEDTLMKKLQAEKEEWLLVIEEAFAKKERRAVEEATEAAESMHRKEVERIQVLGEQRLVDACEETRRSLMAEMEASRFRDEEQRRLEVERHRKEVSESLTRMHKQEMEALRARCRYAFTTSMERSPSESSLEKIERPDSADPSRVEQQVAQLRSELQDCMSTLEKQRQENRRLLSEREDSLRTMQASFTAQKQVAFNEAISRATSEKDAVIRQLRDMLRAAERERELSRMTVSLPSPCSPSEHDEVGRLHSMPESPPSSALSTCFEPFQIILPTTPPALDQAPAESPCSPMMTSVAVDSAVQERSVAELEASVSTCSSGPSGTAMVQMDRVSVFTCNVGDLVLVCYDDKHENYVVFSVGPVYHFVNSDCLESLSLVPIAGKPRRPWALAEITEKEYCEARKVPNRYRVKLGTRFYRVKAKPFMGPRKDQVTSATRKCSRGGKGSPPV